MSGPYEDPDVRQELRAALADIGLERGAMFGIANKLDVLDLLDLIDRLDHQRRHHLFALQCFQSYSNPGPSIREYLVAAGYSSEPDHGLIRSRHNAGSSDKDRGAADE